MGHFDYGHFEREILDKSATRSTAKRVPPSETRRYVQDERYFAIEHKDVRREAFPATVKYSKKSSLFVKVSEGGTCILAQILWILDESTVWLVLVLGVLHRIGYAAFMRETTDEQLMQQYAKGNAKAFDQLYERHRGSLYRYFRRQVGDEATANDLYQGVWEKIIAARKKYRSSSPFTAWMFRIAHNHLVDHFRRSKPVTNTEMDALADQQAQPTEHVIDGQQREQLKKKIAALPHEQRNTLLLKLETGLKMEEIASVTGTSRETVKSRLRYAVGKLKRSLVE